MPERPSVFGEVKGLPLAEGLKQFIAFWTGSRREQHSVLRPTDTAARSLGVIRVDEHVRPHRDGGQVPQLELARGHNPVFHYFGWFLVEILANSHGIAAMTSNSQEGGNFRTIRMAGNIFPNKGGAHDNFRGPNFRLRGVRLLLSVIVSAHD